MPNVMLRNNASGQLVLYITKKDHEETVVALEPLEQTPKLPMTVRVKRL